MAVATPQDAQDRLGRPPTPEEEAAIAARLEDAEAAIMVRLRDMLDVIAATPGGWFAKAVVAVECDVALRAAGLTARITNVQPSPGTITELPDSRPGTVFIRTEEWRRLGVFPLDVWNPNPSAADLLDPSSSMWHEPIGWDTWDGV